MKRVLFYWQNVQAWRTVAIRPLVRATTEQYRKRVSDTNDVAASSEQRPPRALIFSWRLRRARGSTRMKDTANDRGLGGSGAPSGVPH